MSRIQILPRMMTKAEAAAYCRVTVPTFAGACPVQPVMIGETERFDRRRLDEWLDRISGQGPMSTQDWLDLVDREDGRAH